MIELKTLPADCAGRRSESACTSCGARAFSVCGFLGPADLAKLDALAETMTFAAGQPLAHEGEPAEFLFNVTSGSVRVYKLLPDGRRQITGFLFAGDFLGLAGPVESVDARECVFALDGQKRIQCRVEPFGVAEGFFDCRYLSATTLFTGVDGNFHKVFVFVF